MQKRDETIRWSEDPRMNEFVHRVVMLLSRNNLSLQLGQFETQEDLDAMRNELAKHEF